MTQEGGFKINHATLEFGALVHPKHGLNYQRQNLMTLYLLHQPYVMYLELVSYDILHIFDPSCHTAEGAD